MGLNLDETFTNLEREAWRIILLTSQRHYSFKELDKYKMVIIDGVKCKKITNEPLAFPFLGTDTTLIVSGKDPISKLLLTKAHFRSMQSSLHSIHATASTTLSWVMTRNIGVLLTNEEEMIQNHMINCVGCRKSRLLHYKSTTGMSDMRMLPTVHSMSMISIDPIMSWPIWMPD